MAREGLIQRWLGGAIALVFLLAVLAAVFVSPSRSRHSAASGEVEAGLEGPGDGTVSGASGPANSGLGEAAGNLTGNAGTGRISDPTAPRRQNPGGPRSAVNTTSTTAVKLPQTAPPVAVSRDRAGAPVVGSTAYGVPADASYVAPWGSDDGSGAEGSPWRTVTHAVQSAPAGSTVVVRGGVYHESVRLGDRPLTLQPYPKEAVWFSGSEVVRGWVRDGSAWRLDGWSVRFEQGGRPEMVDPAYPMSTSPYMVFADGQPLREVRARAQLAPGSFWVDAANSRLYVGSDPAGHVVEASTLDRALTLVDGAAGSVVRGFGFMRYATHVNDLGAVRGWTDRLTFENDVFVQNAAAGLSVVGSNVVVSHDTFQDNGQLGLQGNWADGLVARYNLATGNNSEHFKADTAAGGIKITTSRGIVIRDNVSDRNLAMGIWCDESVYDGRIVGNLVRGNDTNGIQYEISGFGVIASNAVVGNGAWGIHIVESNDVEVWNNTVVDNRRDIKIQEGTRKSSDTTTRGHDTRRPVPDPGVTWDVHNVRVRNNVLASSRGGVPSMLGVDDAQKQRSASDMNVTADYDAYWRNAPDNPKLLVNWSEWPDRMVAFETIEAFRSGAGQEAHGMSAEGGTDPFVVDAAGSVYGRPAGSPAVNQGLPLPPRVADAVGIAANTPVDIGYLG